MEPKPYLTVIEAAKALSVTRGALYKRIGAGTYPYETIKGKIVIARETVDEELSERRGTMVR